MLDTIRKYRVRIGYVMLCIGITVAITLAMVAIHRVQVRDNATRCSVVGLAVKLTDNSSRNAAATLKSPTATTDQKNAARLNLQTIQHTLGIVVEELHHPHGRSCSGVDGTTTRP